MQVETEKECLTHQALTSAEVTIMQAEAKAATILNKGEARASADDMMRSKSGQELILLGEKTK